MLVEVKGQLVGISSLILPRGTSVRSRVAKLDTKSLIRRAILPALVFFSWGSKSMNVLCAVSYYGKKRFVCGGNKKKELGLRCRLLVRLREEDQVEDLPGLQREFKVSPGNFVNLCLQKSRQV